MPQIKARVDREFGCDSKSPDPDECVAKGAAIYAMNEAYTKAVQDYEVGEIDDKPKPITGDRTTVRNVTSKTYGTDIVNADGKAMVKNLIFANTLLPCSYTDTFGTTIDNQKAVKVNVYESDFTNPETDVTVSEDACLLIDEHVLHINSNWPKGTPIAVTFSIDREGVLSCTATVGSDQLDFTLKITGVKSDEELLLSKSIIASKTVE